MKPSFFIIGAPKCGTTSLTDWLSQHPAIHIPMKEIHFFNTDHRRRVMRSLAQYEALFTEPNKLSGDSSVWYLYSQEAVPNILNYNPLAKFIVCLRDPVEMAFSLHRQLVFNGDEDAPDLRTAMALEPARRAGANVKCYERSHLCYSSVCALGEQMNRLLSHTQNVHSVYLEDMKRDPQRTYKGVLDFLGLPHAEIEFTHKNPAMAHRSNKLNLAMNVLTNLKHRMGIYRGLGLRNHIDRINSRPS